MLKIEPFAKYLQSLGECTSYVGLRVDEPEREGGDYADMDGVTMDLPLRRWKWTLHDVRSYLAKREITIPKRTDCLECFFQRLDEWYNFWKEHPTEWAESEALEGQIGQTFRTPGKDIWPTAMKDLRARFEAGDIPKRAARDALSELKCRVCRL